mgnify:CR=1 FL=1
MRFEGIEVILRELSDSDWQCGLRRMPIIYGGLLGGMGFLDCARNDGVFARQSASQISDFRRGEKEARKYMLSRRYTIRE